MEVGNLVPYGFKASMFFLMMKLNRKSPLDNIITRPEDSRKSLSLTTGECCELCIFMYAYNPFGRSFNSYQVGLWGRDTASSHEPFNASLRCIGLGIFKMSPFETNIYI